jgi:hypothetical protein
MVNNSILPRLLLLSVGLTLLALLSQAAGA